MLIHSKKLRYCQCLVLVAVSLALLACVKRAPSSSLPEESAITFQCQRLGVSLKIPQGWHSSESCCDKGPNCQRVDLFPPEEDSNYKVWNPDDGVLNLIMISREHANYGAAMLRAGFTYKEGVWLPAHTIKGPVKPATDLDGLNWHGTVGHYYLYKQYHMDTGGIGQKYVTVLVVTVQEMDTLLVRIYSPSETEGEKILNLIKKSLTIATKS